MSRDQFPISEKVLRKPPSRNSPQLIRGESAELPTFNIITQVRMHTYFTRTR